MVRSCHFEFPQLWPHVFSSQLELYHVNYQPKATPYTDVDPWSFQLLPCSPSATYGLHQYVIPLTTFSIIIELSHKILWEEFRIKTNHKVRPGIRECIKTLQTMCLITCTTSLFYFISLYLITGISGKNKTISQKCYR